MSKIIPAAPYDAKQCPDCQQWIYIAKGPFAEGDPTKTLADYEHWEREHATPAELASNSIGFPWFPYNDVPVQAVYTAKSRKLA